jgi:hypothetical protein
VHSGQGAGSPRVPTAVVARLSWLACAGSPVLARLCWLACAGSPVLARLCWLPVARLQCSPSSPVASVILSRDKRGLQRGYELHREFEGGISLQRGYRLPHMLPHRLPNRLPSCPIGRPHGPECPARLARPMPAPYACPCCSGLARLSLLSRQVEVLVAQRDSRRIWSSADVGEGRWNSVI